MAGSLSLDGHRPRAGLVVRLATVWVAMVAILAAAGLLGQFLAPHLAFDSRRLVQSIAAAAMGVAAVVAACRVLDRRRLASLGFGFTRADGRALLAGAGLWLGFAAAGLAVGAATGAFQVSLGAPTAAMAGWILLQLILVLTYEALPEELAMRGYVYTNLAERFSRWLSLLIQAVLFVLFGFAIVALINLMGGRTDWSIGLERAILFFTFGITLGIIRLWTGSLWGSIGFHWAFQTVMALLGLNRLTVVRIPAQDMEAAGITLWFFTIVLGGIAAFAALVASERRGRSAVAAPAD